MLSDNKRIESLDMLRGVAILIVFITHFNIIDLKGIGVDLFFVLSGMLVSKSLLSKNQQRGKTFKIFIIKRFTKIVPSYYFFLITGYILALCFISNISSKDIPLITEFPQYFLFFRNYGGPPPRWTMEHVWSLCAEEHFYIFLIFSVFILDKIAKNFDRSFLYLILVIIVLGMSFKIQAIFTSFAEWPSYTHNRIDAFGWGILLYIIIYLSPWVGSKMLNKKILALAGIAGIILSLYMDSSLNNLLLRTVAPICWFLIILGIYNSKMPFLFVFKTLAYYSYSIYLWHFLFVIPVMYYFGEGISGFFIYTFLTGVFSWLTTSFIEEESIKYREKLIQKLNLPPLSSYFQQP